MFSYAKTLRDVMALIREIRLHTVLSAIAAMIELYWGLGRVILQRQAKAGWGAKVIDRRSADLRGAFPDMKGLSPRNLKYMRAFAAAWPDRTIVQERLHKLTWCHQLALLEKLPDETTRLWYAQRALESGWSRNVVACQPERVERRSARVGISTKLRTGFGSPVRAMIVPPARSLPICGVCKIRGGDPTQPVGARFW